MASLQTSGPWASLPLRCFVLVSQFEMCPRDKIAQCVDAGRYCTHADSLSDVAASSTA